MKKITVSDVAQYAGVSPATVSRVLTGKNNVNADTKNKIICACNALGYPYSPKEQSKPSKASLIIMNIPFLDNTIYNDIAKGIKASVDNHHGQMLINTEEINETTIKRVKELIKKLHPAGMIVLNQVEDHLLNQLNKLVPVVQCCEYNEGDSVSFVSIDDYAAGRKAVEHILSTGHQKIAFINGPSYNKYAKERLRGYKDVLSEANLPIVPEWIVQMPSINFSTAFAVAVQMLKTSNRPNAFFAAADIFASAVVRAAQSEGLKVPEDIVVVGFDNLDISEMTNPPLTTINQPKFQQGFTAAELLYRIIHSGINEQQRIFLESELIVRQSSSSFNVDA